MTCGYSPWTPDNRYCFPESSFEDGSYCKEPLDDSQPCTTTAGNGKSCCKSSSTCDASQTCQPTPACRTNNCATDIFTNPNGVSGLEDGCCCSSGGECASYHCSYTQGPSPWTCQPFPTTSPSPPPSPLPFHPPSASSSPPPSASPSPPPQPRLWPGCTESDFVGDFDRSGRPTLGDAVYVADARLEYGSSGVNPIACVEGDFDSDGFFTLNDAALVSEAQFSKAYLPWQSP